MAASTPARAPTTPPPAQPAAPQRGRSRKPSAKVLEAQQSLKTCTIALRSTQKEPSSSLSTIAAASLQREGRGANLDEVAWLIAILKETITQQSNIMQNVVADLAEIKSEQQSLKTQNAELQDEIRSLQTQ